LTQILKNLTNKIFLPEFLAERRKSDKDFTRDRSLTFPRLISFIINMVNGSIQIELSHFFQVLDDSPVALTKLKMVVCINTLGIRSISKGQENLMHEARSETALASKTDPALWTRKYA
jgi:hypothetical protein